MSNPEELSTRTKWVLRSIFAVAPVGGILIDHYLGGDWLGWGLVWVMSAATLFTLGWAGLLVWIWRKAPRPK